MGNSAGVGAAGLDLKLWTLSDLDRGVDIVGQFTPQGLRKTVSAGLVQGGSVNRDYPIVQWVRGELEVVTFSARLWAKDSTDLTVSQRLVQLENLVRRASDLKRPPICAFSLGSLATVAIDCLVKSIGGVTYDDVRPDGTLRGATLQVTLWRYEEVTLKATDPSVPASQTRIRRSKRGDTYESVALTEYGDPELGILLRQLNPRRPGMPLADLNPLDPVHVFSEEFLLTLPIEPEFHAFKSGPGNEAAEERRRQIFDARDDDQFTTIYGDTADDEFL
jgi:hypothetical protein